MQGSIGWIYLIVWMLLHHGQGRTWKIIILLQREKLILKMLLLTGSARILWPINITSAKSACSCRLALAYARCLRWLPAILLHHIVILLNNQLVQVCVLIIHIRFAIVTSFLHDAILLSVIAW